MLRPILAHPTKTRTCCHSLPAKPTLPTLRPRVNLRMQEIQ
jgi:hypothetical protein